MDKDYIFKQMDKWEKDLMTAYSELPQEHSDYSISQKIISKLIAFSKISEYYRSLSDACTKISVH